MSTGYTICKVSRLSPQQKQQITPRHFFDLYFSHVAPKDFFFVQIGANDGVSHDLMHDYIVKYQLSGVLVEPQKDVFEKLKKTYSASPQLQFANIAIAEESGLKTFYKVKQALITEANYFDVTAISSFDKETLKKTIQKRIPHIIAHVSNDIEDYIEEETVSALSFEDFTREYGIKKIDFLFLDCEGYDYEIIKMVDFNKFSPDIVNYESKFFNDEDRAACEALLKAQGYQLFRRGNDTCAFK